VRAGDAALERLEAILDRGAELEKPAIARTK